MRCITGFTVPDLVCTVGGCLLAFRWCQRPLFALPVVHSAGQAGSHPSQIIMMLSSLLSSR
jgi:hypothetical protein